MPERSLGQIVAVEKATRQKDNTEGARIQNAVVRQGAVTGSRKSYQPDADDAPASEHIATTYVEVRVRAEDALKEARKYSVPAMDITASKDATNQLAMAELIVDGQLLVPGVPISHLLWLENYLTEWRNFLAKLPTLDPTIKWHANGSQGLYESEPAETTRALKEVVPLVLHPPTKEHPAQVTTQVKEVPVGKYTNVSLSGAVTEQRKQQLLDRMQALLLAVKDAVTRANKTPAVEVREGDKIMDWLLA